MNNQIENYNLNNVINKTINKIDTYENHLTKNRKKIPKKTLLLVACLTTFFITTICVAASNKVAFNHAVKYTNELSHEISQRPYASTEISNNILDDAEYNGPEIYGKNILKSQEYYKSPDYNFYSVINFKGNKKNENTYTFSDAAFSGGGDAIILTKENEDGWNIKENAKISIFFKQNLLATPFRLLEPAYYSYGYIANGIIYETGFTKKMNINYTLIAPEDGEYYFYIKSMDGTQTVIKNIKINEKN